MPPSRCSVPLLVKGEPGTGKTMLAEEVAQALNMPLLQWHIKSTTKAQQGLYEYDAVSRLRDSQLADVDGGERVKDIDNYIVKGVLWQAFTAEQPVALLIDEIDKADIEFPNDLLREIDRMEFYCYEHAQLISAKHRPLVFITSNNEKELPDAFLRRCFFHYIKFPDADHHAKHRGRALPRLEERAARCRDEDLLTKCATCPASRRSPPPANCWTGSSCWWPKTSRWKPCRAKTTKWPCRRWWAHC